MEPMVILVDGIHDAQRAQLHEAIKQQAGATAWWHRQLNVWIVFGYQTGQWRDLVHRIVPTANVVVMRLQRRDWASWDIAESIQWFHQEFDQVR